DSIDLSIFNDLKQNANGFVIRGTDPSYLNCSGRYALVNKTFASGWSKVVDVLSESTVLKRPNLDGKTFQDCFHANFGKSDWELRCNLEMLKGFVSEIKVLATATERLKCNNGEWLMSYCIPRNPLDNIQQLNIVTERGSPLDTLHLVQLSPQKRHQFVNMIQRFFINYPTLRLHDFRRQQIVLVDEQPKLVDFDGAYFSTEDTNADEYHSTVLRKLHSEILIDSSFDIDQKNDGIRIKRRADLRRK
ncbi:hypothetical protein OSTOST_15800, partial [Ostertagia ostertagi]